jgi:hypothetical protein
LQRVLQNISTPIDFGSQRDPGDSLLTWHLHGSLPASVYPRTHPPSAGHAFGWVDRYLDRAPAGPRYLQELRIARFVIESLGRGEQMCAVMRNHLMQNEKEFERIVAYIENNPVTAGLVGRLEEFAWSSAGVGMSACAAAVT